MPILPRLAAVFTILLATLHAAPAAAGVAQASVGFAMRDVPNGGDPPIPVGIWYPAAAPARPTQIGLYTQTVAAGAPVAGRLHPLVVISHGNGGDFAGHNDIAYALAEAGFVVAAPMHTGDNYADQSRATDLHGRVRQLSAVIDDMTRGWRPGAVDPRRIGAFGFSAGGLTVLIAAGAEPDLARIAPHCAAHPAFFVCRLLAQHHVTAPAPGAAVPQFPHDARLRAIVVAAPALGFTLSAAGLQHVTIPVQLWRADDDRILPAPYYADAVRAGLPAAPDFHAVPGAGHFDFIAPCSAALQNVAPQICASAPGFDRARFHRVLDRAVVGFFQANLK